VVRAQPTAQSNALARLRPGETLPLIEDVTGWYHVQLPDGRNGYVSKAWTNLAPETSAAAQPVWKVHFVDVGTGLATFVEGPDFVLVYDGGSNDDDAKGARNRLLAYIRKVRPDLQVIDHVILSHPHKDHVELLPDLFDAYQVHNVWDSGRVNDICMYRAFLAKIAAEPGVVYHDTRPAGGSHVVDLPAKPSCGTHAAPFHVAIPEGDPIVQGRIIQLGANARITFLHADPTAYPNDVNRNSIPVRLDLGSARLLFMGDSEAGERDDGHSDAPRPSSIEGQLLACCVADIHADFLVAGHHGSLTSSRVPFLDAVGAREFVISSGSKKYSGTSLPDAAIVNDFSARGELWRTDFDDLYCRTDAAKIGPDNDNQPGGCDNILVRITATGALLVNYERIHE
jgi:beta-lactamase superfamily II metal-dependent hydrolase